MSFTNDVKFREGEDLFNLEVQLDSRPSAFLTKWWVETASFDPMSMLWGVAYTVADKRLYGICRCAFLKRLLFFK